MANNIEMTTKCSFTIPGLGCTLSSLLVGTGVGLASFLVGVLLLFSCGHLLHWFLTILRTSRGSSAEDGGEWGGRPPIAVLHRSQRLYDGLSTLGMAPPPSYSEAMAMGEIGMAVGEIDNGGLLDDLPPPYVEVVETRFKNEVRSYCKSRTNWKVVKWG